MWGHCQSVLSTTSHREGFHRFQEVRVGGSDTPGVRLGKALVRVWTRACVAVCSSIEGAGANLERIRAYRFEEPGKGLVTTQLLNQGAAILGTQSRGVLAVFV